MFLCLGARARGADCSGAGAGSGGAAYYNRSRVESIDWVAEDSGLRNLTMSFPKIAEPLLGYFYFKSFEQHLPILANAALGETHAVSKNQEDNEYVNSFFSHLNLRTSFDEMYLHEPLIIHITSKVAILATPNKSFFGSVKISWKMRMLIHISKTAL
jgi:hypothetical protein